MIGGRRIGVALLLVATATATGVSQTAEPASRLTIEPRLGHLRNAPPREWSSFPAAAEATFLEVRFDSGGNTDEHALWLRQQDVKQPWRVLLNGQPLGALVRDEADLSVCLPIAAGKLLAGENRLRIESSARGPQAADDIRVGHIRIENRSVKESLAEGTLEIEVIGADSMASLPARITLVDANGSRQSVAAVSSNTLAVRPGVIYTSNGSARFGVPAGQYTIYAGRGFEYSLAQVQTTVTPGQTAKHTLSIRREVPTPGYVACDTHVHTGTFSGHGDATIDERLITLAGEGIELPIAADHNLHIDYEEHAQRLGVRRHFTPVIGNEVTTSVGHFNVFPVRKAARVPDHKQTQWSAIFDEIFATPDVKIAILNHARDLHGGTRPFGPQWFNAAIGENIAGWPMQISAMEVINSGATQTDPLQLFRDWMALLNRGYVVTPVGSSDSHDVARYIVGQGRTYIRCDDRDVSHLDVESAVANFLQGRVLVSYGLLTELTVNSKYGSGELASLAGDELEIQIRVLGPHWTEAAQVFLYANGQLIRDEQITPIAKQQRAAGLQWQASWKLPRPKYDMHLVAIALGKGIESAYWPTAKPYQPTSPDWEPHVIGASGAVWLDGDNDGRRSTARDYADRAWAAANGDPEKLIQQLNSFDAATAAQAAHLYQFHGGSFDSESFSHATKTATPAVTEGIRTFRQAARDNELTQAKQ